MKKVLFIFLIAAILQPANAQYLDRLGNAARRAAERAVERNVEKTVTNAVDKAFDEDTYKSKKQEDSEEVSEKQSKKTKSDEGWTCPSCGTSGNSGKFCNECGTAKPSGDGSWTCPACGHKGNKGKFCTECGAKQGGENNENNGNSENSAATPEAKKPEPKAAEMAYAKSDFVRGDEVFFEDLLVGEQMGEFPSQWDALNGSVEIGKINGENAIMAQQPGDNIAPLFKDMKSYLPEKFTLEFDFWSENPEYEGHNEYIIQFNDKDNNTEWVQNITLGSVGTDSDWSSVRWQYYPTSGDDWREGTLENIKYKLNSWNHCAISFNKRAMKIYINGVRVANIPNTKQPNNFWIGFGGDGVGRIANASIKNIVLAKGAVPLYDRMMTDGKFITYGITFDVGKSVVKPESMGEITRIVQLMNENPTLKFSVEGHTDATGNAASNQKLSEARANAIVAKLVENGIAKDRLTAVGKGQNNPIADNNTDEGRAKNRRVEFIKQ